MSPCPEPEITQKYIQTRHTCRIKKYMLIERAFYKQGILKVFVTLNHYFIYFIALPGLLQQQKQVTSKV